MASLVNSVRDILGDQWWIVKIGVLSAVLFAVLYISYDYPSDNPAILTAYGLLCFIFAGCCSFSINRNLNNSYPILPGLFNIPEVIIKAIGTIIAMILGVLLYYLALTYSQTIFESMEEEVNVVVEWVIYTGITAFFSPFVFVPVVLYSVNGKLSDAFNFKSIYIASGNFMVQFLSYVIQYILIVVVITLLIYFTLLNMLGDHVILLVLKCIVIVFSVFSAFLFFSDLYIEVIPEIKQKAIGGGKKRKRQRKNIKK